MVELSRKDALAELDELKRRIQELEARMTTTMEKPEAPADELITLREAADMLGCSYRTVQRWMEDDDAPEVVDRVSVRGGWAIRVRKADILKKANRSRPGPKLRRLSA